MASRAKYNQLVKHIETEAPGASKPNNMLEAYSLMWNELYSPKPYMDRVSFDLSFIAIYEQGQDEYEEQKWEPETKIPNALQEEANRRGSLNRGYLYRRFENNVPPNVVFERDKKIKFIDVLITTGREKAVPYPIMFRYYYEPQSQKWLGAFVAEFYNQPQTSRPLAY